jgi:hypothetical protein
VVQNDMRLSSALKNIEIKNKRNCIELLYIQRMLHYLPAEKLKFIA